MSHPDINLPDERLEWLSGTRKEAIPLHFTLQRTIYDPVITVDPIIIGHALYDAEIVSVQYFVDGSSTPSVTFTLKYGSDITGSGLEVVTGGVTATAGTVGTNTTIANGWVSTGDVLWAEVTAKSGTVQSLTVLAKLRNRP